MSTTKVFAIANPQAFLNKWGDDDAPIKLANPDDIGGRERLLDLGSEAIDQCNFGEALTGDVGSMGGR